jgi:citrate lyase beta subunit
MQRSIDAVALGGTLFVPAIHRHLEVIARGEKFPALRSAVFDTEDGIADDELEAGLEAIGRMLETIEDSRLIRFIRPRNQETLERLLSLPGIEKIDGFVLPKFGLDNARAYLEKLDEQMFMPSIEGDELFDVAKLIRLRDLLLPYKARIIAVRFGAEDMMRRLGLRRECGMMLYDMCAPSAVIANMLTTFKPFGFEISAPVYRCYRDTEGFEAEAKRDLAEGLMSKTIIHPDQIEPIERLYRVCEADFREAEALLQSDKAVFAQEGAMAEVATQRAWALKCYERGRVYGVVSGSDAES